MVKDHGISEEVSDLNRSNESSTRRKMLKSLGKTGIVATIGWGATSQAAAKTNGSSVLNTNFDPSETSETVVFANQLDQLYDGSYDSSKIPKQWRKAVKHQRKITKYKSKNWSDEKRKQKITKTVEKLDRKQAEALYNVTKADKIETETTSDDHSDGFTTASLSGHYLHKTKASSKVSGIHLWTFRHQVNWDYSNGGNVWNIRNIGSPGNTVYGWSWTGNVSGWKDRRGGRSYFIAYKKGSFKHCIIGGYGCPEHSYPASKIRGNHYGAAGTVSETVG